MKIGRIETAAGFDWVTPAGDQFRRLSGDPGSLDQAAGRKRLEARLEKLEERVEAALKRADETPVDAEIINNMYRLLGTYRGLSESLVELTGRVSAVDWPCLRESRF